MSLSGFATLTTIITPIFYSIIVPIITAFFTVFFTEYIRRRISSTRSQKIFLYALKDYDKEFLNDHNVGQHYINISFIYQLICGSIAAALLTIIYHPLNFPSQYIIFVGSVIVLPRVLIAFFYILNKKNSSQAYIANAAAFGILNDPTASLIVAFLASIFLLLTLQLWHANFIQNNLEILFMYLVYWLIFAYIPTAIVWWMSRDIRSNITTTWEFMLINPRISDLKTSFKLIVKLNCGHEVDGKLLQVNNFGVILEENVPKNSLMSELFRTYVPWQEVVSIGIVKNVEI